MRIGMLIVLGCCQATLALAGPVSMTDLVGGATITCGNLRFSKFEYSADNPLPGQAGVSVDCLSSGPWLGIRVTGPWTDTDNNGRVPAMRVAYLVTTFSSPGIVGAMLVGDFAGNGDLSVQGSETKFPAFNDCYT
jgi:hypothetical protein